MAKKINQEEEVTTGVQVPDETTDKKEEVVKQKKVEVQTEIPRNVDEILKSFPGYKTLYVDVHGGVYTSDTPETIRGKAILYKNPHYQS